MSEQKRTKTILCWSSGKDSAWTLGVLRGRDDIEVVGLMTTINGTHGRVMMHGVRLELLRAQAEALGLPLHVVDLPDGCSNEEYDRAMGRFVAGAREEGVELIAFGDLFLEDVRAYREERMAGSGLTPIFPLWGIPTDSLAREMVASGLRARVVCVDSRQLAPSFAGREFDASLLADLPDGVDPCGERGEFHTFVHDGPMFLHPVAIESGKTVDRGGFIFADLIPGSGSEPIMKSVEGSPIAREIVPPVMET
jgi:uncharacterized protein (TIGR00290 family)